MGINGLPATSTSQAAGSSFVPGTAIRQYGLQQLQQTVIGFANAPDSVVTFDTLRASFKILDQKTSPDVALSFTRLPASSGKADIPALYPAPQKMSKALAGTEPVHAAETQK